MLVADDGVKVKKKKKNREQERAPVLVSSHCIVTLATSPTTMKCHALGMASG